MKRCSKCGELKPTGEFYGRKRLSGYCKPCDRARTKAAYHADPEAAKTRHRAWVESNRARVKMHKLKAAYGITPEEYAALPQVCVVCGATERLRVDHSHQSGRVRGMLCDPCNKGIGFFRDDPTRLLRAADYLLGVAKPDIFEATYEPVLLDTAPPASRAQVIPRCATCAWWGDGDDRRVDAHGIEIAPCQHPRSPVDEYPDGAFGCVLHEER